MTVFIFDLDGTLVDSFQQITEAANATRSELGFENLNEAEAHKLIGLPASFLFEDITEIANLDTLVGNFREKLKAQILKENLVYEGVIKFLDSIIDNGHYTAVATSKPQHLAELVVQNSALKGKIHFVQGTDSFLPKPNPAVINFVLKEFDDSGIMFGDRPEDIAAAISANIPSVGVAQSIFDCSQLTEAGASISVKSFIDLSKQFPNPTTIINKTSELRIEH